MVVAEVAFSCYMWRARLDEGGSAGCRGTKAYGIITAGEVLLSGGTVYSLEMEVISYEDYCV
jgi:hypothetical protein